MKKLFGILLIITTAILFSSCGEDLESTTDIELQKKTELLMDEGNKQLGMPAIINFQEKKNLKWIYELCDQENFICYAYYFNMMEGKRGDFIGECYGYGVPYSTQYSNPEKAVDLESILGHRDGNSQTTMPQAEPNGLFKASGMSATWLIMVGPKGEPRLAYFEPLLIVSPYKLH